jgi:hypothetical protein
MTGFFFVSAACPFASRPPPARLQHIEMLIFYVGTAPPVFSSFLPVLIFGTEFGLQIKKNLHFT